MLKYALFLTLAMVLTARSGADELMQHVDEAKTAAILEHHWKTFVDNDLEGVLADYTEESVIITPRKTYKGLTAIRENFVSAYEHFPKKSATLKLTKSVVNRDVGYILWNATGPKGVLSFATDTFIVRDGKIVSQTFGGVEAAKP
jgi:hypothetical protein